MTTTPYVQKDISLAQLSNLLKKKYYEVIALQCKHAGDYAALIEENSPSLEQLFYARRTVSWINEIKEYLSHRNEIIIPYLNELSQKETDGHNCEMCSGRCDMQHKSKEAEINYTLQNAKDSYATYQADIAVMMQKPHPHEFRAFPNMMNDMQQCIEEVFYLESGVMLPKIKEAQISINAHH